MYLNEQIKPMVSFFSSVKLTIVLLAIMAIFVLLGAWCPQISQSGQDKVIEQFGQQVADILINLGVADIFHSPAFLILIALLTINIVMGSFKHVFPKLKLLRLPMPELESKQIAKLPINNTVLVKRPFSYSMTILLDRLNKSGYKARAKNQSVMAESGKYGRLAPTVTHIGLLCLLFGLIISSWTGFSGFISGEPGQILSLTDAQHSHLWMGHIPSWHIKINNTRKEDYVTGETKQWFSNISVTDLNNHVLKNQTISVNDPLTYEGMDIYQSSWSLKSLQLRFNGKSETLNLQSMGKLFAAFLPLPDQSVIIFSVRAQNSPLRIFAKRKDWAAPKLITELLPGHSTLLGDVSVVYVGIVPQTGFQYKCDPGFPIIVFAFVLIIAGVSLAAVPHRQIWAYVDQQKDSILGDISSITIGGTTKKGKQALSRQIDNIVKYFDKLNHSLSEDHIFSAATDKSAIGTLNVKNV